MTGGTPMTQEPSKSLDSTVDSPLIVSTPARTPCAAPGRQTPRGRRAAQHPPPAMAGTPNLLLESGQEQYPTKNESANDCNWMSANDGYPWLPPIWSDVHVPGMSNSHGYVRHVVSQTSPALAILGLYTSATAATPSDSAASSASTRPNACCPAATARVSHGSSNDGTSTWVLWVGGDHSLLNFCGSKFCVCNCFPKRRTLNLWILEFLKELPNSADLEISNSLALPRPSCSTNCARNSWQIDAAGIYRQCSMNTSELSFCLGEGYNSVQQTVKHAAAATHRPENEPCGPEIFARCVWHSSWDPQSGFPNMEVSWGVTPVIILILDWDCPWKKSSSNKGVAPWLWKPSDRQSESPTPPVPLAGFLLCEAAHPRDLHPTTSHPVDRDAVTSLQLIRNSLGTL